MPATARFPMAGGNAPWYVVVGKLVDSVYNLCTVDK